MTTKLIHVMSVPDSLIFLRGQVEFLREHGFEVMVATSPGKDLDAFSSRERVQVRAIPIARRITPLRDLVSVARLWSWIRTMKPRIVHAHTPKGGLLGMIASTLAGTKVRVYHMRGLPFLTATGYRRHLLRLSEKLSCRLAHRVLCVSESVRAIATASHLCSERKARVLASGSGNGVDAEGRFNPVRSPAKEEARAKWAIPPDATVTGFVGRIVREKGIVELARAWSIVSVDIPDLHLLLIGHEEEQDKVPAEIMDALTKDPRVHFAGFLDDTASAYAAMDFVVLPTYREGFPNVLLEANSMELPVVATAVPGCLDAVRDGATGTLVPVRNAEALANAIRAYALDPELRRRHGAAGRRRALEQFDPRRVWQGLLAEYEELLTERCGGRDERCP